MEKIKKRKKETRGRKNYRRTPVLERKVKEFWHLGYSKEFIALEMDLSVDTLKKYYSDVLIDANKGIKAAGIGRNGILARAAKNYVPACRLLLEMAGEVQAENTLRITALPTLVRLDAEGNEIE